MRELVLPRKEPAKVEDEILREPVCHPNRSNNIKHAAMRVARLPESICCIVLIVGMRYVTPRLTNMAHR